MSESDTHFSDMQEKSDTFQTFVDRTDALAKKLGGLEAVPAALQISRATLYAYRGRAYKISSKAWRKLESAEEIAGLRVLAESMKKINMSARKARDDLHAARAADAVDLAKLEQLKSDMRSLLPTFERILSVLDELDPARETSDASRDAREQLRLIQSRHGQARHGPSAKK